MLTILAVRHGDELPQRPRMDPEQGKCGSYSATYGPRIAVELGKRETVVGSARTASIRCAVSWENVIVRTLR